MAQQGYLSNPAAAIHQHHLRRTGMATLQQAIQKSKFLLAVDKHKRISKK
jgi:hypothetical protein